MSTATAAPPTGLRDPAKQRMVLTALYIAQEQYGHLDAPPASVEASGEPEPEAREGAA